MSSTFPFQKKRKTGKTSQLASFMRPMNKLTYYEDVYGERNQEDFDEGSIHSCYSSSDEERVQKPSKKSKAPERFFQQFSTPKNKSDRFGEVRTPGKQQPSFRYSPVSPKQDMNATSPTTKYKRSPAANTSKLLTPKKFGLFASPMATVQLDNSAGQMMDDLDGPGPSFPASQPGSEDEAEDMRRHTPSNQLTQEANFPRNPYQVNKQVMRSLSMSEPPEEKTEPGANGALSGNGGDSGRARGRVALMTPSDGEEDGDVEDNATEPETGEEETKKDARALRSKQQRPANDHKIIAVKKTTQPTKPKYSLRRHVLKAAAASSETSTPRRSARNSKIADDNKLKEVRIARSPATRAKQIAASNRSKMTARAVTMRTKAKKVDMEATEDYYRSVYGRKRRAKHTDTDIDEAETPNITRTSKKVGGTEANNEKEDYFRTVYGRKKKAKKQEVENVMEQDDFGPEYTNVIPAKVAKMIEKVGGRVKVVVGGSDVDLEEYERAF